MYKITNRLPQPINLLINGSTVVLKKYECKDDIDKLTVQMKNLSKKWFIRVCKVKNKK
jgi:hypothetical protein